MSKHEIKICGKNDEVIALFSIDMYDNVGPSESPPSAMLEHRREVVEWLRSFPSALGVVTAHYPALGKTTILNAQDSDTIHVMAAPPAPAVDPVLSTSSLKREKDGQEYL